ncbi:MAG TPA: hypothetical protein VF903_07610, partial [Nitrospirota bacterium]
PKPERSGFSKKVLSELSSKCGNSPGPQDSLGPIQGKKIPSPYSTLKHPVQNNLSRMNPSLIYFKRIFFKHLFLFTI